MPWLACRVMTGKEYLVRSKIKQIVPDAEILVPRIHTRSVANGIVKNKSERMLPGYILVGSSEPINPFSIKHFMQVIGPVTDLEIARLRAQEGERNEELRVGGNVLVIDGPLQGSHGQILEMTTSGAFKCKITFQNMELTTILRSDFIAEEK
jgi:transcription antitermination factor NusG